jgi:phage terminase Nu1 subunit (DNA packaging protein)
MAAPSQAERATHIDLSVTQLKAYQAAGVIPRDGSLDETRVHYIRHLRAKKGGITDERARLDAARAELTELEVAQRRGELVRRQDVIGLWSRQITACKARIRSMPKRLVVMVPGFTRAMATAALKLIDEALHELAGDGAPKSGARVGKRKEKLAAAGDGPA